MVPDTASRPSMSTGSAVAPAAATLATCPLCHTGDATLTNEALSAGADWQCVRCGQRWTAARLATVAAYAVWDDHHSNRAAV